MGAFNLRSVVLMAVDHGRNGVRIMEKPRPFLSCPPVLMKFDRSAHSQDLTKNMRYITNDNVKLKVDPASMRLNKQTDKPLCIIMNWMLAKPGHVKKYATLYLEQGFDVVSVSCTPWQLMWPAKGSQLIAADLMKFMQANDHTPLVVHGFSVGAYVWAELLVQAADNKDKCQPVLDRVAAQVWDSAADIHEIPVGFPTAVFPTNKFLQETFRSYIKYHLKTFHEVATKHYLRATEVYHETPCRAPALFLLSKTDPIGAENRNLDVHDCWVKMGVKCNWKCWDKSPHVLHYTRHPQEYVAALYHHLNPCGLLHHPDKMKLRIDTH